MVKKRIFGERNTSASVQAEKKIDFFKVENIFTIQNSITEIH